MIILLSFLNKCPFFGVVKPPSTAAVQKKSVTVFSFKKHVCEHVSHNHVFACYFKSLGLYSPNGHL